MNFNPRFTITNPIAQALTRIERALGFLEVAKISEEWIRRMERRALVLETHSTWSAATSRRFHKARRVAPIKARTCPRTPKNKAASCRRTPRDQHELAACSAALAF